VHAAEVATATPTINTIEGITATNTVRVVHRKATISFSYVDPATKKPIGYAIDFCSSSSSGPAAKTPLCAVSMRFFKHFWLERRMNIA
jgi:hypothetical protein